MTAATVGSAGWGCPVQLWEGQQHVLGVLRASMRHKSRAWHQAPTLRSFGRSPGTAHRVLHRLAAVGVIALQPRLPRFGPRKSQGCHGGLRFTFGVQRFLWTPPRRGQLARMSAGQLALLPDDGGPSTSSLQKPPKTQPPPETAPLERPRTPETAWGGVGGQSEFTRGMTGANFQPWWGQ